MSEETVIKNDTPKETEVKTEGVAVPASSVNVKPKNDFRSAKQARRSSKRGSRSDKPRSEFSQKIINIRRVTRVSSGGRRFSFSVALVLGDRKGSVGVGTGKAGDTALAIDKAVRDAKKHLVKVSLNENKMIPHDVQVKYSSAELVMRPAPGRGTVAGSAVRDVLELAGINNINVKILSGSKNKLNIARAALKALSEFNRVVMRKSSDKKQK